VICIVPECEHAAGEPDKFFGACVEHWIRTPYRVRAPAWHEGDAEETRRRIVDYFTKEEGSMQLVEGKKAAGVCLAKQCKNPAVRRVNGAPWGREIAELCDRCYGRAIGVFGAERVVIVEDREASHDPPTPAEDREFRAALRAIPSEASPPANAEAATATAEAAELLVQVQGFEIATREDLELAAEVLAEAKGKAKALEARLAEITRPLNAALASARELFRPALTHYGTIERDVKSRIAAFHAAESSRNAAALAAASAAHAAGDGEGVGEALAKVAHVAHVEGVSVRYSWAFEVEDLAQVPREFLVLDEAKVKAWIKSTAGKESAPHPIAGIRFERKASVASRSA
jgi:BMFP domain-containing protein YqiC